MANNTINSLEVFADVIKEAFSVTYPDAMVRVHEVKKNNGMILTGLKLNVTFDSFNNKFVMNVKGAMSHPMEVGSDAIRNITRINNVLETISDEEYAALVLEAVE